VSPKPRCAERSEPPNTTTTPANAAAVASAGGANATAEWPLRARGLTAGAAAAGTQAAGEPSPGREGFRSPREAARARARKRKGAKGRY
jgi:hypothetical protein